MGRVMRRCPRDGIRATMHDNDVMIDGNGATVGDSYATVSVRRCTITM